MFSAKDKLAVSVGGLTSDAGDREVHVAAEEGALTRSWSRSFLPATGLALFLVLVVYGAARWAGASLEVQGRDAAVTPVPVGAVVLATLFGSVCAVGLSWLALRTSRPYVSLSLMLGGGLVLSSVPPFSGSSASTTLWLLAMHAVVAVPLVAAAWRFVTARGSARHRREP